MNTTPLNAWHHSHNGRMVDFAGWEMPVQYSSIVEEHNGVRNAVGLFDISHMWSESVHCPLHFSAILFNRFHDLR
jgi:aminomethyltransferase